MAEDLLNALIEGSIDHNAIINGIEHNEISSNVNIQLQLHQDEFSIVREFVLHFLNFVKGKLSRNLSEQQLASCSPKRSASFSAASRKNGIRTRTSLTSRFNDEDVKQESKSFDRGSKSLDNSLSFRSKENGRKSLNRKGNQLKKPRRVGLNGINTSNEPMPEKKFISRGFDESNKLMCTPLTSTPQINRQNQKRRITPTLVTQDKEPLQKNNETRSLFESSPVIDISESSLDSSESSCNSSLFEKKIKSFEKSMRNRKRNTNKISLSAFLSSEEKKTTTVLAASKPNEVASGIKLLSVNESLEESSEINQSVNQSSSMCLKESFIDEYSDVVSIEHISDKKQLDVFVEVYKFILLENLISNICMELYFLFSVVNCNIRDHQPKEKDEVIFESVESCIYFAAKVLDGVTTLTRILDMGTLIQISQNKRLQSFAPDLVQFSKKELNELGSSSGSSIKFFNTSTSLGVPFLIEGHNRKTFISDRHFYSFSKMRDKFYGLVRVWEENHANHAWHLEKELGEQFQSFFFEFREFPAYAQFSQLFVAQLIELGSQDFSVIGNREDSVSTSLLTYMKETNPEKLQQLQKRFVIPMILQGPCPKPYFSDAEMFFRLFIERSCNYHFSMHLKDALLFHLLEINKSDFQAQSGNLENSEDTDSMQQVRSDYSMHIAKARTLAKFLGFVVFSPYETDSRSKSQTDEFGEAKADIQPFDPHVILCQANQARRLIVTIPWLVLYLSMMDELSLKRKTNLSTFQYLASLYRSPCYKFKEKGTFLNHVFILLHLGWLFEQPKISAEIPFYQMLVQKVDDYKESAKDCNSLDGSDIISKSVLIRFCPYLSELKSVLMSTGVGAVRKIKPLTHREKISSSVDAKQQLKETMIHDFFKFKPKYFKETTDFVAERFCSNMKAKAVIELIPDAVKKAVDFIERNIVTGDNEITEFGDLKQRNDPFFKQALLSSKSELVNAFICHFHECCGSNAFVVLSKLLTDDIHVKVVEAAAKIVSHDVLQELKKWIDRKLTETFEKELFAAYTRLLMGRVKRHNKSVNESH